MKVQSITIAALIFLVVITQTSSLDATTWYVTSDGTGDAQTIQAAIDSAAFFDVVVVAPGIYYEHLNLVSGVSVIGENRETTIIDGGGIAVDVVSAIDIEYVEFKGFTVTGAISGGYWPGGAGIFVNFPDASILIEDIIVTGNDIGIGIMNSWQYTGPDIINCDIYNNRFYGIAQPGNGLISGCTIYSNYDGIIQSGNGSQSQIIGNTIWGNSRNGFSCGNDFPPTLINNIFAANGDFGIREYSNPTDPIVENNLFWDNGHGNYYDFHTSTAMDTAAEINDMPNAERNLVGDPLFCAAPFDFRLSADSPAVGTGQNGDNIGALPVGCPSIGPIALEQKTWGEVKALYK